MKKRSTFFCCIIVSIVVSAQGNISGTWEGILAQDSGKYFNQYKMILHIQQEGEFIKGTSYIEVADIFAEMSIEGVFKDNILKFQEHQIIRENIPEELAWCVKQGKLQIEIDDGIFHMVGPWTGNAGISPCQSGRITLKKTCPRA